MEQILNNKNILIVDDSPESSRFMKIFLEMAGASVECTSDPSDALNKINNENTNYDVILSDINMPQMNGYEFVNEVRKNSKMSKTPIIAVSGHDNLDRKSESFGFHSHLVKPVDPQNLISHLGYLH